MKSTLRTGLCATAACLLTSGCITFTPPSPLLTLGGPRTTPRGSSETAVAVGGGGAWFSEGSAGGYGIFGRYKHGISERWDLGVDAVYVGYSHSDKDAVAIKGAMRYQLAPQWRLELGLGVADSTDGRSVNGDAGITWGTLRGEGWNYYTTLRGGGARSSESDYVFGHGDNADDPDVTLPDAFFGMLSAGAQTRINARQRFVVECGVGFVDPQGQEHTGGIFYVGAALLWDTGRGHD